MVKGSAGTRPVATDPAVLGRGLRVVGRVRGEGDLQVEAEVEGDVSVSGTLELGEPARITGSVQADAVVVAGQLEGDVSARTSVAITATGRLRGTIKAQEVSLEEGGSLDGRIETDVELPEAIA
jgi:cytoskeletal protein CcmA (bactofilin family)